MINRKQAENLANIKEENCISIYVPTHRAGHNLEDNIRFKNALSETVDKLTERGMTKKEASKYLKKGYELLDDAEFWMHQSDGLAVFIGNNTFEYHTVPVDFNPLVHVHNSFYIRPIFPLLTGENRFFLLALSQNEVRFFEGNQYSITPVTIKDLVPANMEEALMLDPESSLQHRAGQNGQGSALYHGQGEGKDNKNAHLRDYFNQVDKGLMNMLHDERVPMVIAAVDYLVPIYKEATEYSHIMDVHVSGNPEHDDPTVLHEKAWTLMKDYFNEHKSNLKEQFTAYMSENKASFFIYDIVPAAVEGKVDTLFMNKNLNIWGKYNKKTHDIEIHKNKTKNSDCLLEIAARETYLQGGTIYNVPIEEMPQMTAMVNAIYRY